MTKTTTWKTQMSHFIDYILSLDSEWSYDEVIGFALSIVHVYVLVKPD